MTSDRIGSRVRSALVEVLRTGPDEGSLRKSDRYSLAREQRPLLTIEAPLGQEEFLRLSWNLRYRSEEAQRRAALDALTAHVSKILGSQEYPTAEMLQSSEPLQIDMVLSPAELSALPFEAARGVDGEPLFVRTHPPVVLTRRVRQDFQAHVEEWPTKPRVLFAIASPPKAGPQVPVKAHKEALRRALRPWIEPLAGYKEAAPDERSVLTILEGITLEALRAACTEAVESGKPYTHIHLLAHGLPVGDIPALQRFGLAFHSEHSDDIATVTGSDLVAALSPAVDTCVAVTLAACDSGNENNSILSERSIAHQLHCSGFPIVIASQLPLTFQGSSILAREFYGALLIGEDARLALHRARVALYKDRGPDTSGHDWASMVGYVQLPEGYADMLVEIRLQTTLAALRTAQSWTDHLIEMNIKDPGAFDRVGRALGWRIAGLEGFVKDAAMTQRFGVLEENYGLLGSAEKRLAELLFVRSGIGDDREPHWGEMMHALGRSLGWYRKGYRINLSHHWTGVQQLSLEAVLQGQINVPGLWHAAVVAAEYEAERDSEIWALGSIAELWLLAPFAGQDRDFDKAADALTELRRRVETLSPDDRVPIEATRRQLERYVNWWTVDRGVFPGSDGLAAPAQQLADLLG